MKVIVAGLPGIKMYRALLNAEAAIAEFNDEVHLNPVQDISVMRERGAIYTPTVIVENNIVSTGRIPSVYEFKGWIQKELNSEFSE